MGARGDARAALRDWLVDAEIAGLDLVRLTFPGVRGFQWDQFGSGPHRCQAVIFLANEGELRFAIGGATSGKKRIDYLVSLELFHRSTDPDQDAGMDDFDRIVDAIKTRLRADHRFGSTSDVVWQAGEGGYGIQLDFEPMQPAANEAYEQYGRIRFEITQWINA